MSYPDAGGLVDRPHEPLEAPISLGGFLPGRSTERRPQEDSMSRKARGFLRYRRQVGTILHKRGIPLTPAAVCEPLTFTDSWKAQVPGILRAFRSLDSCC